jgi:uncharacterized protein
VSDGVVTVLVALAIAVGIAGTVLPVLPGLVLVWVATLVYGLATGFGAVGWTAFAAISLLGVVGVVVGLVLAHPAAGASGAARTSVWLGFGLGVVGFFVVPVVGLPLGMVLGLYSAELARTKRPEVAWTSTWATIRAFGLSSLVQLAAGLAMAVVWLAWVLL